MQLNRSIEILSERIASNDPLDSFAPAVRHLLAEHGEPCSFEAGQVIQREDEPATWCYVLLSGQVKMQRGTADGRHIVVTIFSQGQVFNVVPLLGWRNSDADLVALGSCQCIRLSRPSVLILLSSKPEVVQHLLPVITSQMVECGNCLVESVRYRVEVRFAHLFLKLSARLGVARNGATFLPVPLSRQDLAGMTGTTIETCIRVMSRWSREGTMETVAGGFLIHDQEALEALALD